MFIFKSIDDYKRWSRLNILATKIEKEILKCIKESNFPVYFDNWVKRHYIIYGEMIELKYK